MVIILNRMYVISCRAVKLSGNTGYTFRGFMMEARKANDNSSYGTFNSAGSSDVATLDCFGGTSVSKS